MKKQQEAEGSNVVPLDSKRVREQYIRSRQAGIRERYRKAANYPPDKAGIAGLYFVVLPDGGLRTSAVQVEPEHVDCLVDAMVQMQGKLLTYKAEHARPHATHNRVTSAVIKFMLVAATLGAFVFADSTFEPSTADTHLPTELRH